VFSKTWDCATQVSLMEKEMAMPGEDAKYTIFFFSRMLTRFKLNKPLILFKVKALPTETYGGRTGPAFHIA
jgi:hypothetical protein